MSRGRKLKPTEAERAESIAVLRDYFPQGSTAHTVLCSVSQSGMSRHIKVIGVRYRDDPRASQPFVGHPEQIGEPVNLSWHVARVFDYPLTDDHNLVVGGAGMDMGFHVIYSLSRALYGNGYAVGQAWL